MKYQFTVAKDGAVETEVLERQGEDCKLAVTLAQRFGEITEHERTGPDCDDVHERIADGSGSAT